MKLREKLVWSREALRKGINWWMGIEGKAPSSRWEDSLKGRTISLNVVLAVEDKWIFWFIADFATRINQCMLELRNIYIFDQRLWFDLSSNALLAVDQDVWNLIRVSSHDICKVSTIIFSKPHCTPFKCFIIVWDPEQVKVCFFRNASAMCQLHYHIIVNVMKESESLPNLFRVDFKENWVVKIWPKKVVCKMWKQTQAKFC